MSSNFFRTCDDPLNLQYRIERISTLAEQWNLVEVRPLVLEYKIPEKLFNELITSVGNYVFRCLQIPGNKISLENLHLDKYRESRKNITPNGACVPKLEYQFLYNDVLQNWFRVFRSMISSNESILKLVRVTPNIRLKFGRELEDNEKRGLNTQLPHSDAWVEGPWGFNVFTPLFGDCQNNTLRYYDLPNGDLPETFFSTVGSYTEKQKLISKFKEDLTFLPKAGHIYISDYAIVHKTWRSKNSSARVSIDTTLLVGNHDVHPDRRDEYLDTIPDVGNSHFFKVMASENAMTINEKKTTYSHYTTGTIQCLELPHRIHRQ